jgi:Zn-dependent M28 family amino/carboxypeptidase
MSTPVLSVSSRQTRLACSALLTFAAVGCAGSQPAPQTAPVKTAPIAPPIAMATTAVVPAAAGFDAMFTARRADAAAQITASDLREHIAKLASDEFTGRGPTTPGDRKSRAYLAQQLQRLGYQPGAEGSWEQAFDLVGVEAHMPKRWTFARDGKSLPLTWQDDYIAASGVQTPQAAIRDAEVVFVGYGIQAPEYGWDDFKGRDLRGKVLLMLNDDPNWDDRLFAGKTRLYYGRWTYKVESAERHGAAGAILIHTTPSAGYPFQVVQSSWTGPQYELPKTTPPHVQLTGWVTEAAAQKLVELAGKDLPTLVEAAKRTDFAPVALGVTTSIAFKNSLQRAQTANVYGLLPGADAKLREQVVIYTAHHDHLGVGQPDARGDRIYNGALDNSAGVAQLLAIARAFKALPEPPRRSVLFLFVGAEEQGLLGSAYYAANPSFPREKIAAAINYDGGNIWGRARDVTFIGKGKSTLDPIVEAVAVRQGRTVKGDRLPDRGYFYRSDQFSFAKIGVPAIYIDLPTDFVGKPAGWGQAQSDDYEAHRYHQPSDELDPSWNFDGMIEDAQLGFWAGVILADQDAMPAWLPGDEFERAR